MGKSFKHDSQDGITLVIAILLTFLFISVTTAITTFAFRELRLSGGGAQSLRAFYAADTALECVLDADLNDNVFIAAQAGGPAPEVENCGGGNDVTFALSGDPIGDCGVGASWCYEGSFVFTGFNNNSQYQADVQYIYLNNTAATDDDEVVISARGRFGNSGSRTVERGLEYRYLADPNG